VNVLDWASVGPQAGLPNNAWYPKGEDAACMEIVRKKTAGRKLAKWDFVMLFSTVLRTVCRSEAATVTN
jgi:hypothetical protein